MAQQHTPYDDQIEMYYAAGQKLPDGLFHKREGYLAAMDAYADLLAALKVAITELENNGDMQGRWEGDTGANMTIPCPLCRTPVPLVAGGTMVKMPNGTLRLWCTNPNCSLSRR